MLHIVLSACFLPLNVPLNCFPPLPRAALTWTPSPEIDGPGQVEVKDVTDSSALVSWSQPVVPMDRVAIFYTPTSDPSDVGSAVISPPDKQYSIDVLMPDTEYTVSLTSMRGNVTSDPVTTTFTTGRKIPKPMCVCMYLTNYTLVWYNLFLCATELLQKWITTYQ